MTTAAESKLNVKYDNIVYNATRTDIHPVENRVQSM